LPDETRLLGALVLSYAAARAFTPVAIRVAVRTAFYDRPAGYKAHAKPTAYLGGAALVAATVLAGLVFARGATGLWTVIGCAAALWAVGTLDDRIAVSPFPRLIVETGAAVALWELGIGWSLFDVEAANLALTVIWVVGLVNAFNLMDNMDGAAATVGAVCSFCAGLVAMLGGDMAFAALAFALAGACLGFLPSNLRANAPARIFLGDGGSMPLGFIVAAILMAAPSAGEPNWSALLVAGLIVGLPILDTFIVVVSRARRRVPVYKGARDHLTHRLSTIFGSPRAVALALGLIQLSVGIGAVVAAEIGASAVVALSALCLVSAAWVIALEARAWRRRHRVSVAAKPSTGESSELGGIGFTARSR
jgi:UDP-GlcNAc:undecaprenyl-phosphate GlcNAc-1-phosphate transferase